METVILEIYNQTTQILVRVKMMKMSLFLEVSLTVSHRNSLRILKWTVTIFTLYNVVGLFGLLLNLQINNSNLKT